MTSYVALYGDPVEGNPTSRMQNEAFRAAGLDWLYLDIQVAAPELPGAVRAARALRFGGLNLTLPHKVAILPLLDELERSAAIASAVNTVRRDRDGRLIGSNTDGLGFLRSIRDAGFEPRGAVALLLGAGGAARAVAVELALAGASRIVIANRDAGRRDTLLALVRDRTGTDASGVSWTSMFAPPPCDVVVNCTPIGMGTGAAALAVPPVDLAALPAGRLVCDLNPDRADTAFLAAARAAGHRTLGGLPMLARQGAAGFEAWTGAPAPLDVMIAALEASGQPAERSASGAG
jgi:shikimate dehydrogenase